VYHVKLHVKPATYLILHNTNDDVKRGEVIALSKLKLGTKWRK